MQQNLKKELLEQVSQDMRNSQDPQKEALKLVQSASEINKQFESALKKPIDDELLKTKNLAKKNVQFAETIKVEFPISQSKSKSQEPKSEPKIIKQELKTEQKQNQQSKNKQTIQSNQKIEKPQKKIQTTQIQAKQQQQQQQQSQKINKENNLPKLDSQIEKPHIEQQQQYDDDTSSQENRKNSNHICRKHSKEREQNNNKYEELLISNSKQIQQFTIENGKLNSENSRLININEILKQELTGVQQQQILLKKQIEELDKQLYEQKQNYRQELLQLKDQLQDQKFQCSEFENRNNYLNKVNETLSQNLKQFEQEVAKLTKINLTLTQQQTQEKLSILEKEGNIERLQRINNQQSNDLDQLNKQFKDVNEKHKQLLIIHNQLENQKNQAIQELEFRRSDQSDYLNSLKDKIIKLTNQRNQHEEEVSKLIQQIQDSKSEKESLKLQYEQMKILCAESEELRKRLKLKEIENEQLQSDNDKLKWKVRKDPHGILSDLKIMPIQAEDPTQKIEQTEQLTKLDFQIRQLTEENNKLTAENKQLLKQIQQTEQYIGEIKMMFDRERSFLEDKIYNKEREINELILRQRHEIVELQNKNQEYQKKYENLKASRQSNDNSNQQQQSRVSPYNVPQLQAKIKSYI